MDAEAINRALWGWRVGVLEVMERLDRVKFVVGRGVVLLPAPGTLELGRVEDGTLSIPDEGPDGLALQVEVRLLDIDGGEARSSGLGALLDRWEGYHGRPATPRFAVAAVLGARLGGVVIDGEGVELVNTLENEGSLLRLLNRDRRLLEAGASRVLRFTVHEAAAVGVDQRGIDLRTRTGIVRVNGPSRMDGGAMDVFARGVLAAGEGGARA